MVHNQFFHILHYLLSFEAIQFLILHLYQHPIYLIKPEPNNSRRIVISHWSENTALSTIHCSHNGKNSLFYLCAMTFKATDFTFVIQMNKKISFSLKHTLGCENTLGLKVYIFFNRNHDPLLPVRSQLVTVRMLTVLQIEDYYSR